MCGLDSAPSNRKACTVCSESILSSSHVSCCPVLRSHFSSDNSPTGTCGDLRLELRFGPSNHRIIGSLIDWTSLPRRAQETAPTLVHNGEVDNLHDIAQVPLFELIPRVWWITFTYGGQMCHLEEGLKESLENGAGASYPKCIRLKERLMGQCGAEGADVCVGL